MTSAVSRWLARLLLKGVRSPSRLHAQPLDAVARHLSHVGWREYREGESYSLEEGIELVEASWSLAKDPETACRLGLMYERANRNSDITALYREALRLFPAQADLRYQAAAHMLRHADGSEIRGFLEFLREVDPVDPFLLYTTNMMRAHADFVAEAVRKVGTASGGLPPVLMCFPVWGEAYVGDFMRFACSSLLAPGNLPQASQRWAAHILVFTSTAGQATIRAHPLFDRLERHATMHFLSYPADALDYGATMETHYGSRLGALYARVCKFQLHSSPHYATLEAGRHLGAFVMPLAADVVFGDGTLVGALALMDGPVDAVNVAGFRLLRDQVLGEAEPRFRQADGVLAIPASAHGGLVAKYLSRDFFADAESFTAFPLFVCWRIAEGGVVAHVTHFHPICLRATAFIEPIEFTIDPVDGRFLGRHHVHPSRIHLVTDMSVSISDWNDDPTYGEGPVGPMVTDRVSLFLWMYWDELREYYFRAPVRIGASDARPESWSAVERRAKPVVDAILIEAKRREAANRLRRSWKPDA